MTTSLTRRSGKPEDTESFIGTFFEAFAGNPTADAMFPRGSKASWDFFRAGFTEDIKDPNAHFLAVEDTSTSPPTLAGFCEWLKHPANGAYPPVPDQWPEDGDRELAARFFGASDRKHHEVMGNREHWYLELIAVKRAFAGKGVGKMLVGWGCERANEDGCEAYLDSTPEGYKLYEKFGFRVVEIVDWSTPMYTYEQRIMFRDRQVDV